MVSLRREVQDEVNTILEWYSSGTTIEAVLVNLRVGKLDLISREFSRHICPDCNSSSQTPPE